MAESLLMSRMRKDSSPAKLHNLSPDKYGKAAWAELTYTPCKLADNVIYREATTLKKHEEGSNKLRQFEAMNGHMRERLAQLQQERDGIEVSLTQQVNMYKKMYHESEGKHEARLKEIQKRFCSEITALISQKQQEAKFSQAEKEMFEQRIAELEEQLAESADREDALNQNYGGMRNHKEKLELQVEHLKDNLCNLEKERAVEQSQWKKQRQDHGRRAKDTERGYQEQIQNLSNDKVREKEAMERLMRTELEKAENLRSSEALRKTQEMREIMLTFENQTKRLNQIIAMKDRMLEGLTFENAKTKENLVEVTANYEGKVTNLSHKCNDLTMQLDHNMEKVAELQALLDKQMTCRADERDHLGRTILELKEELQRTEVAFVRERDKYEYWGTDLEKQNLMLKTEHRRVGEILEENDKLSVELRKLRDLLMESSYEIERSKEELVRISYERDALALKVENMVGENDRLYRMKRQVEEESAKQWRNTYYGHSQRLAW